jgi:hypothetical protein
MFVFLLFDFRKKNRGEGKKQKFGTQSKAVQIYGRSWHKEISAFAALRLLTTPLASSP